jgi:hypothetical protein
MGTDIEEVTFKDLANGSGRDKTGYGKVADLVVC